MFSVLFGNVRGNCRKMLERIRERVPHRVGADIRNSVRPILFVFEGSQDRHASLNAGWFVQALQSPVVDLSLGEVGG